MAANLPKLSGFARLVMPLVDLMASPELSDSDKAKVADAIRTLQRSEASRAAEAMHLSGAAGQARYGSLGDFVKFTRNPVGGY